LTLAWPAVDGAAGYHVTLSPAIAAADLTAATPAPLDDLDLPAGVTRYQREGLPAGRYVAHLAAIDATGLTSAPAPALELIVGDLAAYPPGAAAPLTALPVDPAGRPLLALGSRLVGPGPCALGPGERADEARATQLGLAQLRCTAFGLVAAEVAVTIAPVELTVIDPVPLPAERPTRLRLRVTSTAPLGRELTLSSDGARLADVARTDDGFTAEVTPARLQDRGLATLALSSGDILLGEVTLSRAAPPPRQIAPATREVAWFALDLGGHLGVLALPAAGAGALGLGASPDLRHALSSGPTLGASAALFPTRRVGLGLELTGVAAGYADAIGTAGIVVGRAHLIVRALDDDRFGLRLLAGADALALTSTAAGSHRGVDGALHWGAAFTVALDRRLAVAVEALHTVAPARDGGYASAVGLQLAVTTRLGRLD
jgi:hypothetical protein